MEGKESDRHTPALILLRGLPGSGKSTLAHALAGDADAVYSVDDFFTDEAGNYCFVHTDNHLAYKQCEENVKKAMERKTPKIFCHNVFSMDWEMEPYLDLGRKHGYKVHVVTVENYHGGENTHDIPAEQIEKMRAKFKLNL